MEGKSFEHMQREQSRERMARFDKLGPIKAGRLAELINASVHTKLSESEADERTKLMKELSELEDSNKSEEV